MTYRIAHIPGDGIGPEVCREAWKCVREASGKAGLSLEVRDYDLGGERFLRTGEVLSDAALAELTRFDAIFLGAVGTPDVKPGVLEKGLLLKLRFELDQYINLRPIKLYPGVQTPLRDKGPEDIDLVVVRENTECLYTGVGGIMKQGTPDEVAQQTAVYTRKGTERCVRWAFELARTRPEKQLTLVDKANVLTYGHDLWRRVFEEVGAEYPDIARDAVFVDACCMYLVECPQRFDTVVTCNMFGDIITDLGASIQGGIGIAASGNLNPEGVSMFEPVHGSAPQFAGKNVVNPLAAILAGGMMLEHMRSASETEADAAARRKAAGLVDQAVTQVLAEGKLPDLSVNSGVGTDEVGDMIAQRIADIG